MKELVTEKTVIEKVTETERTLNQCFNMLLSIKNSSNPSVVSEAVLRFQPVLAECLFGMMSFYQQLKRDEGFIISKKNSWNETVFKMAIKDNATYQKVVRETICIGKTLGDAFAWIFYSRNQPELDQHFAHKSTGLFVSGIGGKGEIEFIKNNQNLDGLFVIYHGITNILRIGDFSLYEFGRGIVGVGELKSKREGNRLIISAHILSKVDIRAPEGASEENTSVGEKMSRLKKEFPSIVKQIKEQEDLVKTKENEHSTALGADFEYNMIDCLSKTSPVSINDDQSLLLYAVWSSYSSMFDNLSCVETVDNPEAIVGLRERVLEITKPDLLYNELIVSKIDTKMISSRKPVFWWPINDVICKNMYFQSVFIGSVFNPAKLVKMFLDEGFSVLNYGKTADIVFEKVENGKRMRFASLQMYFDLINHSLMKTESAFEFAKQFIDTVKSGDIPLGTRVDLHIHLNDSPPSHDRS